MSKVRIAIIGAGPCGLAQLLAFKQDQQEQRAELVCFERQSDWGGLWLYTSHIGTDVHGEPIHSSMYRHLWANGPKEMNEFGDYTFYDHFGCHLPSFLPRALILDYFTGRYQSNDLRKYIRFNTSVRHVDFDKTKNEFRVEVEDLLGGATESLTFDRIVVSVGHFNVPHMIHIDGMDQFPGRVLHAHDFRGADEFVNMNLLLIGGYVSAEDIALQCYKFGARSIIISSRREPVGLKWPANVKETPMVVRMEGRTAHFKDGSSVDDLDAVIFCTGYRHSYPFIAKNLRLHCDETEVIPLRLYKSIFWNDQPYLAYLASIKYTIAFTLFDMQVALVRDVFLNAVELPEKDERQRDIEKWKDREKVLIPFSLFPMIDYQLDYMADIIHSLHPANRYRLLPKFNFEKAKQLLTKYAENKLLDVLSYRDKSYESILDVSDASIVSVQNTKSIEVFKPWIENMDETVEKFLSHYQNNEQLKK